MDQAMKYGTASEAGTAGVDELESPPRERDAERTAGDREDDALGEQLADDAVPAGA
jgi:hypothetical protein